MTSPLQPGTTLARYRIESKLGEGGMGVVWKATDVDLHRSVALKVLPEAFARDPERVARFEREARVLASLNHPNIAAIYGLESDGPLRILAMEFVPGDTLQDRLARGALAVHDALAIALKIAEALESAHERGIVHRDLKPANVAVTPEGDVKLLDFGLARAFAPDGETGPRTDDSPTISAMMTRGDVILGTAAYMSPEQARGKLVDRRSDIWSFGLVLFEMLTGKTVFDGETTTDLLASVLRQDIPWDRLPASLPEDVPALLERCLTRDPRERLRDIGEARITLKRALASPSKASPKARRGIPRAALLGTVVALLLALGAWALGRRTTRPPAIANATFDLATLADPQQAEPMISPDGRSVAYVDHGQLWVRNLEHLEPRSILTDGDARHPFWSPDSRRIGYLSGTHVRTISLMGGTPETIGEFSSGFGLGGDAGAWMADGRVLITQGTNAGLLAVPEQGGEARTFLAPDTTVERDYHDPSPLPGGKGLLVVAHARSGPDNISLVRNGKVTRLLTLPDQNLARPQYASSGHIVFDRTTAPSGIWAVPFSLASLTTTGDPFLVVDGGTKPSVGSDGSLSYIASASQPIEFCWVDRTGAVVQHLMPLGSSGQDGGVFDLSPDGSRAVATIGPTADLWIYELARGNRTHLTQESGLEVNAIFTPDGKRILYQGAPRQVPSVLAWSLVLRNADGTGAPDTLERSGALTPFLSKDGVTLYWTRILDKNMETWMIQSRRFAGGSTTSHSDMGRVSYFPRVSPDGKWLAYDRNDIVVPNGRPDVILQSLATGTRTVVGTGLWPKWNERGDRLYFVERDDMMEVEIGAGDPPITAPPRKLFTRAPVDIPMVFGWTPQFAVRGDRFLILRPLDDTRRTSLVLVQNWAERFRKK